MISKLLHKLNYFLSFFSFTTQLNSHGGTPFVNLWAYLRLGTEPQQKQWRNKILNEMHNWSKGSLAPNELLPMQHLRSCATSILLGWESESKSSMYMYLQTNTEWKPQVYQSHRQKIGRVNGEQSKLLSRPLSLLGIWTAMKVTHFKPSILIHS